MKENMLNKVMKYAILFWFICTSLVFSHKEHTEIDPSLVNSVFEFKGEVTTTTGQHSFKHNFKGRTTKTTFECSWEQNMGVMVMRGLVKIDGSSGVFKMDGMEEQTSNAMMAIASATGVSGGSAHLMYSIWKGESFGIFPNKNVKERHVMGKTIISGVLNQREVTVTMKGTQIVSVESVFDPAKQKQVMETELTDEVITEVLKATNKEVTPEAILEMKTILKEANQSMGQLKDKIFTKTVFTIIK